MEGRRLYIKQVQPPECGEAGTEPAAWWRGALSGLGSVFCPSEMTEGMESSQHTSMVMPYLYKYSDFA